MRILFCNPGMPEARQLIAEMLHEHECVTCTPDTIREHLAGVDIITPFMSRIDAAILEQGSFGLVQQIGVGLEGVDIATATDLGVWVARVPSVASGNAQSVAEHTLLLMLALSRQLERARHALHERHWFFPRGQALLGKTACIVGLGGIGCEVAERLAACGMSLTAVRANPQYGAPAGVQHVFAPHELHTALATADYVILAARYDQHNHHMINAAALAAMKPGAYLINVARGGLVDHEALLAALQSGHLAGAGLDVFWEEPVDPSHPLFAQNVLATPHIAGVTDAFHQGVAAIFCANVRRFAQGQEPLHTANRPAFWRTARSAT